MSRIRQGEIWENFWDILFKKGKGNLPSNFMKLRKKEPNERSISLLKFYRTYGRHFSYGDFPCEEFFCVRSSGLEHHHESTQPRFGFPSNLSRCKKILAKIFRNVLRQNVMSSFNSLATFDVLSPSLHVAILTYLVLFQSYQQDNHVWGPAQVVVGGGRTGGHSGAARGRAHQGLRTRVRLRRGVRKASYCQVNNMETKVNYKKKTRDFIFFTK